MATSLLLSPLSSSSLENRELSCGAGLQKSSFVHNTKQIFSPPPTARRNTVRRWCFRSPVASSTFDYIPKRFREENLKDGLMDNYKNIPQSLYGLNARQLDMFMAEDNPISRQSEAVTEESISARHNYLNNGGMYTAPSKNEKRPSRYSMSMSASMYGGRGGFGRPRSAPPDLPSLLLDSRIVYLGMPIVPSVTELIVAQFMWLDYDSDKPIYLYINSPGTVNEKREIVGSDTDAYTIADMMHHVKGQVYTVNLGMAYGQAAMLLSIGAKGYRAVLPSSYTKFYMPSVSRSSGPSIDMWIKMKELNASTEAYLDLLVEGIGKPKDEITKDVDRGLFMNPQETVDYGAADKILYSLDEYDRKDYVEMAAQNRATRKATTHTPGPRAANSSR